MSGLAKVSRIAAQSQTGEVVEVTPALAEAWLRSNPDDNRRLQKGHVTRLARDMAAGAWRLTHQGIAFDANGSLVDGQHRLHAVVESGATVSMWVVRGSGIGLRDPIDTGMRRSMAYLTGLQAWQVATIRCLRHLCDGHIAGIARPITMAEVELLADRHGPELEAVARVSVPSKGVGGVRRLPSGVQAACVYAYPLDAGGVEEFCHGLLTGEMLTTGSPVLTLRNWVQSSNMRSTTSLMASRSTLAALVAHFSGAKFSSVYPYAETGYRKITSLRRVAKVPHTPSPKIVRSV